LILARTKESATRLSDMFKNEKDRISKKYISLLINSGKLEPSSGRIVSGITKSGEYPNERMRVTEWHDADDIREVTALKSAGYDLKRAETFYSTLESKKYVRSCSL
jgi:23S rRNA-/tRNA-specific pseudouridylate synthase